jgi:hypothetical protein
VGGADRHCSHGLLHPGEGHDLLRYQDLRCYAPPVIVTRTKFPDGTKLVLQVEEPAPVVELEEEDERAIDRALASVRAGKGISLDKFRAILQRL